MDTWSVGTTTLSLGTTQILRLYCLGPTLVHASQINNSKSQRLFPQTLVLSEIFIVSVDASGA